MNIWRVKRHKGHCGKQIGVTTSTKQELHGGYYLTNRSGGGITYAYGPNNISEYKDSKLFKDHHTNVGPWKDGETVTVVLDFERGKIIFWKDEKKMGDVTIKKGEKYHPAIGCCSCQTNDYQLITG